MVNHIDSRGELTVIEGHEVPFEIQRVYWIKEVPSGKTRAGHASRLNREVLVAIQGSFDVTVDDGYIATTSTMSSDSQPLLIESMRWHTLTNFSPDAIVLVLASRPYDEADYIRDYDEFKLITNSSSHDKIS